MGRAVRGGSAAARPAPGATGSPGGARCPHSPTDQLLEHPGHHAAHAEAPAVEDVHGHLQGEGAQRESPRGPGWGTRGPWGHSTREPRPPGPEAFLKTTGVLGGVKHPGPGSTVPTAQDQAGVTAMLTGIRAVSPEGKGTPSVPWGKGARAETSWALPPVPHLPGAPQRQGPLKG